MSGPLEPAPGAPRLKDDPEALELRARPRPAIRFRRGLIIALAAAVALSLVALSWIALEPPSLRRAAGSIDGDGPAGTSAADALADAPASYGDVPKLGPPLPGDLGRPILERRRRLAEESLDQDSGRDQALSAAEAERQRRVEARKAALSSPVIVQLAHSERRAPAAAPEAGDAPLTAGASAPAAPVADSTSLQAPFSSWTLSAGTIIPASLVTGLNSDLPGTVIAQVTQNVSDSATGRTVLVPQGARLIGRYDSSVNHGQQRALVAWTSLVFPDGSSVELDNIPATDSAGYSGLRDGVDSHTLELFKGIALSTLLGVGTELSLGSSKNDLVRAVRESAQQNSADAGDRITSRNLDIKPTLTVRPGWPVKALLTKDLVLRPWRGG